MGGWKEYGFWDSILLECDSRKLGYLKRLEELKNRDLSSNTYSPKLKQRFAQRDARQIKGLSQSLGFMQNHEGYFDHFKSLVKSSPDAALFGDITPSYARLNADHFEQIKVRVGAAGFDLKPVFIMREPLSRIKSAYAMQLRRSRGVQPQTSLEEFAVSKQVAIRTKYERTVTALDSVFAPGEVYYAPFESFFTRERLSELCSFLTIDYEEPEFEKKINRARHSFEVDSAEDSRIRKFYESTYQFIDNRFPHWEIRDLWDFEASV